MRKNECEKKISVNICSEVAKYFLKIWSNIYNMRITEYLNNIVRQYFQYPLKLCQ